MADFKAGDKFIFHKCKHNKETSAEFDAKGREFTIGKVYEIITDHGELSFEDNEGDPRAISNWFANKECKDGRFKVTKIVD